jgi:hypothetical protein
MDRMRRKFVRNIVSCTCTMVGMGNGEKAYRTLMEKPIGQMEMKE